MADEEIYAIVEQVADIMRARGLRLATAESCTGGWVAKALTDVAGSSAWFERGFVTYTNEAKQEMLGVRATTLKRNGAVSEETVTEMALGALKNSRADVSVAISGIAGPGGATETKPVGMVCFGWASGGRVRTGVEHFTGDREAVRRASVLAGLRGLLSLVGDDGA